jgi:hypothetical protein
MPIKHTCPLGSTCKKTDTEGNLIERCRWLIGLQGNNPQTNEPEMKEECSMAWMPLLMIQSVASTNGVQASTESFRNEMTKSNEHTAMMMAQAIISANNSNLLARKI